MRETHVGALGVPCAVSSSTPLGYAYDESGRCPSSKGSLSSRA
jgi:hypothetical protein